VYAQPLPRKVTDAAQCEAIKASVSLRANAFAGRTDRLPFEVMCLGCNTHQAVAFTLFAGFKQRSMWLDDREEAAG